MPRISSIEILQRNEQPVLFIPARTPVENLPAIIGESYGKMAAYLKEMGEFLSDVPYVAYHNMDMSDLKVEIGFPTAKALPGKGDIEAGSIPAGKSVFCMYRGPYTQMETTYEEMATWIKDKGLDPVGVAYEYYYNGPEFPEIEWLTMIVMPIR